jgi:hypothetical protein
MALDTATRNQLIEAREKLIAQLDELEFRATAAGFGQRGGGPPDYREVYGELKNELREIDELLESDDAPR